jgi:hypothetical protein
MLAIVSPSNSKMMLALVVEKLQYAIYDMEDLNKINGVRNLAASL